MATFVLVHGAFRGAWSWDRVARILRARGHDVFAPTLTGQGERAHLLAPGQNVDTYAQDIVAELRLHDLHDVTLVAHSFGGYPVTVAADREASRISRLVYLDAAVPVDGQSNAGSSPGGGTHLIAGAGVDGWSIDPMPVELLEVNPADREFVRSRLTPMPLAAFVQRVRLTGAVDAVTERDFVLATGWRANPFTAQAARLREVPGWNLVEIASGHELMLDEPVWVADYLSRGEPGGR